MKLEIEIMRFKTGDKIKNDYGVKIIKGIIFGMYATVDGSDEGAGMFTEKELSKYELVKKDIPKDGDMVTVTDSLGYEYIRVSNGTSEGGRIGCYNEGRKSDFNISFWSRWKTVNLKKEDNN